MKKFRELKGVPTVKDDPDVIRQGQDVTILAPTVDVAADFGPAFHNKENNS